MKMLKKTANNKAISRLVRQQNGCIIVVETESKSKREVENFVIDALFKTCFDFKIIKSTKTLFVVK